LETHALLAMQKVVGSDPISRFVKGLHLQVFLFVPHRIGLIPDSRRADRERVRASPAQ
jgi:hypothetical protein